MYLDLKNGGEDTKLQSAVDMIEKSDYSLYQFNIILEKINDEIMFGNCVDDIEPMDEPELWTDYQIAMNTLEIARLQLCKVARAMTLNKNRKEKTNE